jgi:hypothetical protein
MADIDRATDARSGVAGGINKKGRPCGRPFCYLNSADTERNRQTEAEGFANRPKPIRLEGIGCLPGKVFHWLDNHYWQVTIVLVGNTLRLGHIV